MANAPFRVLWYIQLRSTKPTAVATLFNTLIVHRLDSYTECVLGSFVESWCPCLISLQYSYVFERLKKCFLGKKNILDMFCLYVAYETNKYIDFKIE